ncbi:hypothetical protein [Polyangium mundeleinium]|uniref:EF-hand domain-containing protein n=1 Tax=Polyangium mundeleinium TaxID=2995306 RepID=A0ABT5EIX1_9BACT|nr:hypothetical protein [Polyangium mundeleinium]MDC0741123.1 hypothetical protein [Polyangium mundeleinium]
MRRVLRSFGLVATVAAAASCHEGIDTTRIAPPKATLGDDLYGVLCDRIGASSLTEDLTGGSYHAICHYSNQGIYADTVDTSFLPPARGAEQETARALGIAKVEAMAKRRSDLVQAFNAIFPDIEIDDVTTEAEGDKVRLHDALLSFSQNLSRLYESNPFEPQGTPTVPASTRALGEVFASFMQSEPARQAFSKIWGRQGYRPTGAALGAVRPLLSYPRLRPLLGSALDVLAPEGVMAPELAQILRVVERDLATSKPTLAPLVPLVVDPATAQPNRPMETLEMLSRILLDQDARYAKDEAAEPTWIARRDRRGFVVPFGNVPGQAGTVPAPFADTDGDGFADTDEFGQFVTDINVPVAALAPFSPQGTPGTDAYGRAEPQMYEYVDTSRTLIGAVAQDLAPLVDATQYAPSAGDDAWKDERETLMYAVAGATMLLGDREDAVYDLETEEVKPAGTACASCVPYRRFKADTSPLPDLAHALGQILADPESDALVLGLIDLVENHEQELSRLLGAALKIRKIAEGHDVLAAQGKEKLAEIPYEAPIWDEIAAVMGRVTQRPGLTAKLIGSFADPAFVTPTGGVSHMGESLMRLMTTRDEMTYYDDDLNGPAWNVTTNNTLDPSTPVDRTKPLAGENRSCWERTLDIIHHANNVKACNKQGAKVKAALGSLTVSWPLIGSYDECELLAFPNLGVFYLDSVLPANHPKRAEFKIKSGTLEGILNFLGAFTDKGALFEQSSGITGLTLKPEPKALNRLVFFGATSDQFSVLPDIDLYILGGNAKNKKTNDFISNLIEPVPTVVCPQTQIETRKCQTSADILRLRGENTLFVLERFGFYDYLRPLVTTFANATCTDAGQCQQQNGEFVADGEVMLLDLIEILKRHWPGPDHGAECDSSGDAKTNPLYCSGAGVNTYEPILADAFMTDIVPALHEFSKAMRDVSKITVARGPNAGKVLTGADVLEKTAQLLFDPAYAAAAGMTDRKGNKGTTWVDGTPQAQHTVFTLFADGLHGMDLRFDNACGCSGKTGQELSDCQAAYDTCKADAERRKGQWKRARSQLVDQFLAVEGEGAAAKFANPAIPRALSTTLRVFREQVNAHCPDRENGTPCTWAKDELGKSLADGLDSPMVAALVDLLEKIRQDETARRELERLLDHLLSSASDGQALEATLSSLADALQALLADTEIAPLLNAAAPGARPEDEAGNKGALPAALQLLKALNSDVYDKYHVMDYILPNLVTPMDPVNGVARLSPLEIIMDTVAEVSRIDAAANPGPLAPTDYETIFGSARDFLTSPTRGLEQIYTIVQKRPRQ